MTTNIVFDVREPGKPRVALGIYPLRGGYTALMCIGDKCFPFTPSPELLAIAGVK